MMRSLRACVLFGLITMLAGCGPKYSPDVYSGSAVQQANKVDRGIVVGVRQVDVSAAGVAGAAVGGAAGGIAGSQTPGGSVGSAFGALGGALLGGLVGAGVEHAAGDTFAYEYIVRKSTGDLVSVTQKDRAPLQIGAKVLVIAGSQARVVPDYTDPALASAGATATAGAAQAAGAAPPATETGPPETGPPETGPPETAPPPAAVSATPLAPLPPLPAFNAAGVAGQ